MGLLRYLLILLLLIPSVSWGACTYTAGSISCPMAATTDICYATSNASCTSNFGSTAYFNQTGANQYYYYRWQANVPKNATITHAYIYVKADNNWSGAGSGKLELLDTANQTAFTGSVYDTAIDSSVTNAPSAWTKDTSYNSADIASLITAWIGMAGYAYGNMIGIRASTDTYGPRSFYSAHLSNSTSVWPKLNITFTGGDPVATLVANYPHSYTKQRVRYTLYNTTNTQKLKVYLDEELVYTKNGSLAGQTVSGDEYVEIDYTGLSAGEHTLRLVVTDASDTEYASTSKTITWTTTHSGAPTVGFDENNNFVLGGTTKFFPVTSWMDSYSLFTPTVNFSLINAVNTFSGIGFNPPPGGDLNAAGFTTYLNSAASLSKKMTGPINGIYMTSNWHGHALQTQNFSETFEATGYDLGTCGTTNCWTATGTVNADYGTALADSQSVEIDGTSSASNIAYTLQEDAYVMRVKLILKETTTHAAQDIITLKNSSGSVIGKVTWNANGTMTVTHGTETNTSAGTFSANTKYYVHLKWISAMYQYHWDGAIQLLVSESTTTPTYYTTYTAGILYTESAGSEDKVHTVEFGANGAKIVYDNIADWMDAVDDYIDAVKSNSALLAYNWLDEPELGGVPKGSLAPEDKALTDITKIRDTNHPSWVGHVGYPFGLYGRTNHPANNVYTDSYGPGTNASTFNNVPTPIIDILTHDYYPYEYRTSSNTTLEDYLTALDYLHTVAGDVQPVGAWVEIGEVHDNYAESYLEVSSITGSFTKGDTITATSGGTCVIPTTEGPTIISYVRTTASPQIIACSSKTGTFGVGDTLTATSGGTAIYTGLSTTQPRGWVKSYDWTAPPTYAQLNNMLWLSIIHDMKMIGYFDQLASDPEVLTSGQVNNLNTFLTHITALTNMICGVPVTTFNDTGKHFKQLTSGSSRADAMVRTYGGQTYVFVSRVKQTSETPAWPDTTNTNSVNFTITVPGFSGETTWNKYFAGGTTTSTDGVITAGLTEYQNEIYYTGTAESDTTAPTLSSWSINAAGTSFSATFNENVTATINTGFALSPSGGAATLTYASGSGTGTLVYTINRTILHSETVTATYTQPGNGIEDASGNDLASISSTSVTNNSTQSAATAPTVSITTDAQMIYEDSLTVTGTASDDVSVSSCKFRIGSAPDATHGTACTGTTSWSCATSLYSNGANNLYVGCVDGDGSYGVSSIVVTYQPPEPDTTDPIITAFVIPSTATNLTVAISSFTCTDETSSVTYCLSETDSSSGCSWSESAPQTYTFGSIGNKTLYAFCKDVAGNVSDSSNDSVSVSTSNKMDIGSGGTMTFGTNKGTILLGN